VFVVNQQTPGGRFDEHKVVLGCRSKGEARKLYLSAYSAGWKGLRSLVAMTRGQFLKWLYQDGATKKPAVERYAQGKHAPKGGITIGGKQFDGGQFIPGDVVAKATPEERQKLDSTKTGHEAISSVYRVPEGGHVSVSGKKYQPGETIPTGAVSMMTRSKKAEHLAEHKATLGGRNLVRSFVDASGNDVPESVHATLDRLYEVGTIPPELSHIQVNTDPDADVWVIGRKPTGQLAYIRNPQAVERDARVKWKRTTEFIGKALEKLRTSIEKDAQGPDGPNKEAALALLFLDLAAVRVDSSEGKQKGKVRSYGASSIEPRHVKVDGDRIDYSFIGKEGVRNHGTIRNDVLSKAISARIHEEKPLFRTSYKEIGRYFKRVVGSKYLIKDLRTAAAYESALEAMESMPEPKTWDEFKSARQKVGAIVGERLHHNPEQVKDKSGQVVREYQDGVMALDNYINPEVFTKWQTNLGPEQVTPAKKSARKPASWRSQLPTPETKTSRKTGGTLPKAAGIPKRATKTTPPTEPDARNRPAANVDRERYARKSAKGQSEFRWVTIGGHEEDGKEHAGGTPVLLDGEGRIAGEACPAGRSCARNPRPGRRSSLVP